MDATLGSRTSARLGAVLVAIALSVSVGSSAAHSDAPPPVGRALAVSVPPEPIAVTPGDIATVPLRVLNPGLAPVTINITGGVVDLGDEGGVTVWPQPDPEWQGLIDFPAAPLTIPPQGYLDVALSIRVPAQISPDLYFIGFHVTPVATGAGIKVVSQIDSFVTLDVPGPRDRDLNAMLDGSGFVFGSQTDNTLRVRNVGHAAVQFWGWNDTTSSPGGGTPEQQRIEKLLLPVGDERSLTVTGKPAWPIGFVTTKVHIIYPGRNEDSTQELVLTKRVLVVNPMALAAAFISIAGVIAVIAIWAKRRWRRRRQGCNESGSEALGKGEYDNAKQAIESGTRLSVFRDNVEALQQEWTAPCSSSLPAACGGAATAIPADIRPRAHTPRSAYRRPVLEALVECGGRAPLGEVLDRVEERMRGILVPRDYEPYPNNPHQPRWRQAAQSARNSLVSKRLVKGDSPRGKWEISDSGREALRLDEV
jgi:hypothetical protein